MPASPPEPQSFSRVLEVQRRTGELLAEHVRALEEGWVLRTPSLSAVWALNHVRVTGEITPDRAVELCRTHLDGLTFHHLLIEDEATGLRLAEALRPAGWEVDVELHSVLARDPDRDTDTSIVIEPEEDEELAVLRRWLAEDRTLKLTEDELDQVVESERLTWQARRARRLGVRDSDGALAGITLIYFDGPVAQVENVYVIPEARGRGYARALVTRAAALAREEHELTFIVADDNDWPKQLYAKLGFAPVGRTWLLHHPLKDRPNGQ